MIDFLKELNEAQQQAVVNYEGPSLIIAGAGSGKTRVLTFRIAYLLQQGVSPRSILALTFTNKAAAEMKERIASLVGDKARSIWMGTFHSVFARILRQESEKLGYPSTFTIYDTVDSKSVISSIVKEQQLDAQIYKTGDILGRISSAKNNLITWQAYQANTQLKTADAAMKRPKIADIYMLYTKRCKKAGAMDFDDLLLNTNILFRDFPEVLDKYQGFFKYILVDEYQDTNYSQYLIVKKLAASTCNLCVVGDDAQSIYSFRGARIENILHFKSDYNTHKLYKLEQNYRSTQTLVNAANSIIDKNKNQIPKKVWSDNENGEKIKVIESATDHEEAFYITNSIAETRLAQKSEFSDFAILYRTNAQSRVLEESLRKRSIPYKIYGNLSFYQRKEIKDVLSYCKLVVNPHDDEAVKRAINYPSRGIGDTTFGKIIALANEKEVSIWSVISQPAECMLDINKGTWSRITGFVNLVTSFSNSLYILNAYDIAMQIVQSSGIINDLKVENSIENLSRIENIEELLNAIKDGVDQNEEEAQLTLDRYLENVSLLTDQDQEKDEDRNKVTLMTIHASKGLEFKHVYLVGLEESLFPNQMSMGSLQELEEERRLFYVALTRAKKQATITYALSRYRWGTPVDCTPSRFINDIDPQYLEYPEDSVMELRPRLPRPERSFNPRGAATTVPGDRHTPPPVAVSTTIARKPVIVDPDFKPDDPRLLREGQRVTHQSFGEGEIVSIEGDMPDAKAVVRFDSAGDKKLLLKFARLKIMNN